MVAIKSKRKSCSVRCAGGRLCTRCCPDQIDGAARGARIAEVRESLARGIPHPTELEWPHRPGHGRCCARHAGWAGLDAAVADALSWGFEGDHTPQEIARELARDPRVAAWATQARECADQMAAREARGRRGAVQSTQRDRAQARSRFERAGGDVTGREYRDTLRSAEAKRAARPRHKAAPSASRGASRR